VSDCLPQQAMLFQVLEGPVADRRKQALNHAEQKKNRILIMKFFLHGHIHASMLEGPCFLLKYHTCATNENIASVSGKCHGHQLLYVLLEVTS